METLGDSNDLAVASVVVVPLVERGAIELRFMLRDGNYASVVFSQVGAIVAAGELLAGVRELWRAEKNNAG